MNTHAQIGHNNPPASFDDIKKEISDLYDEAKLWLDGVAVETQEQADALNTLMTTIRDAAKRADEMRKAEAEPHDEAKAEIQTRYNELIGKTKAVTGLAVRAQDVIKQALRPFLERLEAEKQEAARKAKEEAAEKERLAMAAMQSREIGNLEQSEQAEALVKEAKDAQADARRASNDKAHAKGSGRAVGLRTVRRAVMVDEKEAARWAWQYDKVALLEFAQSQADKALRAGCAKIGGFEVREEKIL